MAQQTAVDWLQGEIEYNLFMYPANTDWLPILVDKAKEMEKEQHDNTWIESRIEYQGDDYIGKEKTFEQYYNETFIK